MSTTESGLSQVVEIFRRRLTICESGEIPFIRRDLSQGIFWGKLADHCLRILLSVLDAGVYRTGKHAPDWLRPSLHQGLTVKELEILYHPGRGKLRREYLSLLLLKKLLGAMTTKVKQQIAKIEPMTGVAENDYYHRIEDQIGRGVLDDDEIAGIIDRTLQGLPNLSPVQQILCPHTRTNTVYPRSDFLWRIETCKDCGQVVQEARLGGNSTRTGHSRVLSGLSETGSIFDGLRLVRPELPKAHRCRAAWVAGKEGHEAFCPGCKKTITDPETYLWSAQGLEPFGDDPSQDELVVLLVEEKDA